MSLSGIVTFVFLMFSFEKAIAKPITVTPAHIFEVDQEQVSKSVNAIKKSFKEAFDVDVTVKPELTLIDNEEEPFGDYSFHKITFGKINKKTFDRIKSYYTKDNFFASVLSDLSYDPDKEYQLIDFLAPKIQPLPGKMFHSSVKIEGQELYSNSNCWTTVYDVLMSLQDPYTIHGAIVDELSGGANILNELTASNKALKLDDTKLVRPYDYYIQVDEVFTPTGILHIAINIGPGIVFEKSGLGIDRYNVRSYADYESFSSTHQWYRPIGQVQAMSKYDIPKIYLDNVASVVESKVPGQYVFSDAKMSKAFQDPPLVICSREDAEKKLCSNYPW